MALETQYSSYLQVISAAHCFRDLFTGVDKTTGLYVTSTSVLNVDPFYTWQVLGVYLHPTYVLSQPEPSRVDIAILKISPIQNFTSAVQPIILARPEDSVLWSAGSLGTVSGFGSVDGNSSDPEFEILSPVLRAVNVPIVSETTCNSSWLQNGLFYDWSIICAGSPGKDACVGDSGGPLALKSQGSNVLIGIVISSTANSSSPIQCGAENAYGTYTNVANYRSWIENITGPLPSLASVPINQGNPILWNPPTLQPTSLQSTPPTNSPSSTTSGTSTTTGSVVYITQPIFQEIPPPYFPSSSSRNAIISAFIILFVSINL